MSADMIFIIIPCDNGNGITSKTSVTKIFSKCDYKFQYGLKT